MTTGDVEKEYQRLLELFANADAVTLAKVDGLLWEAARTRANLDELNAMPQIEYHPTKEGVYRVTDAARQLTKVRASYTHIIANLVRLLGGEEEQEDDMSAYE